MLSAFHELVSRADLSQPYTTYDNNAAGPLVCFSFISKIGIEAISVNLVYTTLPDKPKTWPTCWMESSFSKLWRIWSTCKVRSLTSATDEMNALNPPGRRQNWATTTIKNDSATVSATHTAHLDAITSIRRSNTKDVVWTLVLQPLLADWVHKGNANPLGLDDCAQESLVIVSFTVNWPGRGDDAFVDGLIRHTIQQIDDFATAHKKGHPFRCLNYCGGWQSPFKGYGEENWQFLRTVSRRYDPDGLFQLGCVGGFKLDVEYDRS